MRMMKPEALSRHENARTRFFRYLDRRLLENVGSRGMAIVAHSEIGAFEVVYQSTWSASTAWPLATAAQVVEPSTVDGFAVEPMRVGEKTLGAVVVSRGGAPFEPRHRAEIREIGDLAAAVIFGRKMARTANDSSAELEILLEAARALSAEPTLDGLFARFHALVSRVFEADIFLVAIGDDSGKFLRIPFCVNDGKIERGTDPVPVEKSLSGFVFREGKPLLVKRREEFDRYPSVDFGEGDDVESALVVPLRASGNQTIGVISVQSTRPEAYTERHRSLLAAIGEQAAIAVRNAQHLEQAEQRARELELLAEVARALSLQLSMRTMCQTVAREVRRVMDAPAFFVALRNDDGKSVRVEYATVGDREQEFSELPLDGSISERVLRERKTVVLRSLSELEQHRHRRYMEEGSAVQSVATAPLVLGDQCFGVISAQSYKPNAYGEDHVRLLTAIAEHMALAVQNAQFFRDAESRADRDPVTNLFHHRYLRTRFEEEVERSEQTGRPLSLVMLDLDNFRLLNETHSHSAGDEALRAVKRALQGRVRADDVYGRYGADEFIVIMPGGRAEDASTLAEDVEKQLASTILHVGDTDIPLRCAIGTASHPEDGRRARILLAKAEAALFQSRREGVSTARLQRIGPRRLRLEGDFAPVSELIAALLARDPDTASHLEHVNGLAKAMAAELRLPAPEAQSLLLASVLHDIGKIAIPDEMLKKPGKLSADEISILRRHPRLGADLIRHIPGFGDAATAVLHHHERFDGRGYPDGLRGCEIPLVARALSVIDAYSAMLVDRPYHKGILSDEALVELSENAGTQFDPMIVERFAALVRSGASAAIMQM